MRIEQLENFASFLELEDVKIIKAGSLGTRDVIDSAKKLGQIIDKPDILKHQDKRSSFDGQTSFEGSLSNLDTE